MTMIVHYQTKKDLKTAVGQPLKYPMCYGIP
jgi:hypothetical protein